MLLFIFYIDKILPFCSVFCKFIQEVFIIQRRNIRKYLIISAKYCIIYKPCTSSSVDRATASGAVCGGSIPLWCIFFMVKRTKTSALKTMFYRKTLAFYSHVTVLNSSPVVTRQGPTFEQVCL